MSEKKDQTQQPKPPVHPEGCKCQTPQPMLTEEKNAVVRCAGCGKPVKK